MTLTLYSAEHGPKTDDEVNIIQAGKNYGWPHVAGYKDDKAYVYANWSASTTPCQKQSYKSSTSPRKTATGGMSRRMLQI
jgi:glucose/arabinose dehydrogenase